MISLCKSTWLLAGSVLAGIPASTIAQTGSSEIFESNVTNNLNWTTGEPQIAVNPMNPRNLLVADHPMGTEKTPAYSIDPTSPEGVRRIGEVDREFMQITAAFSEDGGRTWRTDGKPGPLFDPKKPDQHLGGDPMAAAGPDGTLYVAGDVYSRKPGAGWAELDWGTAGVAVAWSGDGGKTFSHPQLTGTPNNRPWMTVDQSTGTVYTVSFGWLDPKSGKHGQLPIFQSPDDPGRGSAIADRWLVAWSPRLASKSEPRRLGGPDFSASLASTITAAHGVIAATFAYPFRLQAPAGSAEPPLPASLRKVVPASASCTGEQPCLFFQTSKDQGKNWTRHYVPIPDGISGLGAHVAADPVRPGHYAIGVATGDRLGLRVLRTSDSGATWASSTVPQAVKGVVFKQWMAAGPTGVLGYMWRKELPVPLGVETVSPTGKTGLAPGYDIYASISCDGGKSWETPLRVNKVSSPPGPAGWADDMSHIALDDRAAHVVWADRRHQTQVKNVAGAWGGQQTYYGHVPFKAFTGRRVCKPGR